MWRPWPSCTVNNVPCFLNDKAHPGTAWLKNEVFFSFVSSTLCGRASSLFYGERGRERERDRDRETETDRHRQRERDRDRQRQTDAEIERQTGGGRGG